MTSTHVQIERPVQAPDERPIEPPGRPGPCHHRLAQRGVRGSRPRAGPSRSAGPAHAGPAMGAPSKGSPPASDGSGSHLLKAPGPAAEAQLEAKIDAAHVDTEKIYPPNLLYAPTIKNWHDRGPELPPGPRAAGLADYGVLNSSGTPSSVQYRHHQLSGLGGPELRHSLLPRGRCPRGVHLAAQRRAPERHAVRQLELQLLDAERLLL